MINKLLSGIKDNLELQPDRSVSRIDKGAILSLSCSFFEEFYNNKVKEVEKSNGQSLSSVIKTRSSPLDIIMVAQGQVKPERYLDKLSEGGSSFVTVFGKDRFVDEVDTMHSIWFKEEKEKKDD